MRGRAASSSGQAGRADTSPESDRGFVNSFAGHGQGTPLCALKLAQRRAGAGFKRSRSPASPAPGAPSARGRSSFSGGPMRFGTRCVRSWPAARGRRKIYHFGVVGRKFALRNRIVGVVVSTMDCGGANSESRAFAGAGSSVADAGTEHLSARRQAQRSSATRTGSLRRRYRPMRRPSDWAATRRSARPGPHRCRPHAKVSSQGTFGVGLQGLAQPLVAR